MVVTVRAWGVVSRKRAVPPAAPGTATIAITPRAAGAARAPTTRIDTAPKMPSRLAEELDQGGTQHYLKSNMTEQDHTLIRENVEEVMGNLDSLLGGSR